MFLLDLSSSTLSGFSFNGFILNEFIFPESILILKSWIFLDTSLIAALIFKRLCLQLISGSLAVKETYITIADLVVITVVSKQYFELRNDTFIEISSLLYHIISIQIKHQ